MIIMENIITGVAFANKRCVLSVDLCDVRAGQKSNKKLEVFGTCCSLRNDK